MAKVGSVLGRFGGVQTEQHHLITCYFSLISSSLPKLVVIKRMKNVKKYPYILVA